MTQLTTSERRVIAIAALGYTSRRIAAEPHISTRTVEVHIRHIYEKLGIKSRDELIDWAAGESAERARKIKIAVDIIDRTLGWKHLRKYGQMSEEWMDSLRDGLARSIINEVS